MECSLRLIEQPQSPWILLMTKTGNRLGHLNSTCQLVERNIWMARVHHFPNCLNKNR